MQHGSREGRVFPLSRYFHYENFWHYYAFGNSPAEDFLQSVAPSECRRPSILSLGCGDVRSILFTIFKNFGFEGKNSDGFKGVHFVLNDRSGAILARNIIFLYLCMRMPEADVSKRQWIASMWSIWYNHELLPQHDTMLSSALAELIQWSYTWQEWSECPLGGVVRFSSPATFATVKRFWEWWHTHAMTKSVDEMKTARRAFQYHHIKKTCGDYPSGEDGLKAMGVNNLNNVMLKNSLIMRSSEKHAILEAEYLHYLTEGTVWAEDILDIPTSISGIAGTVVNPTLFECTDGMYTLHYALNPYNCFTHSFQYTSAEVGRTFGKRSSLLGWLPIADCHFQSKPLLANSVQQFSMWLEATANLIKKSRGSKLTAMFDLDDSINLCCSLLHHPESHRKFDAIYTSNLFDHISPPALVLSTLTLLKSNGTLFTATFKSTASNSRKYLEKVFGFSPELFPVFLGIRCIGQDGDYSSTVNPEPCPNLMSSVALRVVFPWRNVNSQALVFDNIQEAPVLVECLLKLCTTSCLSGLHTVGSVESFLCILHQFLRQFKSQPSHSFLKSLGSMIQNTCELRPHLMQLQTQSLLHGVHIHITLTEDDCPVCRDQPLDSYIQQFSVSFDMASSDANIDAYEAPTFTIYLATFVDFAVVTSLNVNNFESTFELLLYLPKHALSQYNILMVDMFRTSIGECVFTGTMDSLKRSSAKFVFLKDLVKTYITEEHKCTSPLGGIVRHIGDGCSFETVISMSKSCQGAMKVSKLDVKCLEDNQLLLHCRAHMSRIVYPYAIDESNVHIKISQKSGTISVTVQRAVSEFYKEKPMYYIDPSNALTLPKFCCDEGAMEKYCSLQILPLNTLEHPLFNAKCSFTELFEHTLKGETHFTLSFRSKRFIGQPDVYTLVCVHDLRFSTAFSSPVLDMSYCFFDTKPVHLLGEFRVLCNRIGPMRCIFVDDAEYKLLKKVFKFFSTITRCALSTEKHTVTSPVQNHRLCKYFDRAILFPFYPNPAQPKVQEILSKMYESSSADMSVKQAKEGMSTLEGTCIPSFGLSQIFKLLQNRKREQPQKKFKGEATCKAEKLSKADICSSIICARCKKPAIMDCSCKTVSYCSKACQTLEWPEHSMKCKQPDLKHGSPPKADASSDNKVCVRCKKPATIDCCCNIVSYCSKACQTLEWPEHSEKCDQPAASSYQSYEPYKDRLNIPKGEATGDNNRESSATATSTCFNCKKLKSSLKYCKCHEVLYCSVECQRLHWPQHKATCTAVKKL